MYHLIINNLNTSHIPHCYVTDFGKAQTSTPRVVEQATVYGANGSYDILDGAYESYERTVTFYVAKLIDIARIVESFQAQNNVIEFGYQKGSYYYADFKDASYRPNGPHAFTLEVRLEMQPFRYEKEVPDIVLTQSKAIYNPGTVYSEPIVTLKGRGETSLTIGSQVMRVMVEGALTIDCRQKHQNLYGADKSLSNLSRISGGFFEIPVGTVGVVFDLGFEVTIKGNWRYLV